MSADKRSVTTDALDTLGTIIDDTAARDAIHLAVEPVVASEPLYPGQDVGLDGDGRATSYTDHKIGIVDPFVLHRVEPGQRFWLVIYPRKITSLRHVWTHPDIDDAAKPAPPSGDKRASETWLRGYIRTADCPDYDTVIAAATGGAVDVVDPIYGRSAYEMQDYGDGERYLFFSGRDAHGKIPDEFWDHLEVVTGQEFPRAERATHFSCSC